jgi:hypothetical protein
MALKRKILVVLLILLPILILVPAILLSTPMMDRYQRRIDRDPNSDSSKRLQLTVADWCARTWRPEMAATGYRRYYERYKSDIRRAYALLRYAQTLEDCGRTADAKDIYEKYLAEYPDLDGAQEAKIGVNRIKFSARP